MLNTRSAASLPAQYQKGLNEIDAIYRHGNDSNRANDSYIFPPTVVDTANASYLGTCVALKEAGLWK